MSFISDIVDFAGGAIEWLGSNSVGAQLAKTAALGFIVNQTQENTQRPNNAVTPQAQDPIPNRGVRLQVTANPENRIPVVYGQCHISGLMTDAEMVNNNQTLWLTYTICERTGTLLSTSAQSVISFLNVYINDQQVVFDTNGYTVLHTLDRNGTIDRSLSGLVDIYLYNNGSTNGTNTATPAYDLMPSWSNQYTMNELVFAVIKLTYNPERGLQKIPEFRFHVSNTITLPGDAVYDYMTNTRYGAGIAPGEIYSG